MQAKADTGRCRNEGSCAGISLSAPESNMIKQAIFRNF